MQAMQALADRRIQPSPRIMLAMRYMLSAPRPPRWGDPSAAELDLAWNWPHRAYWMATVEATIPPEERLNQPPTGRAPLEASSEKLAAPS